MTINGEGSGIPLQYSCLENPMGGGAWWAAVPGVTKSRKRLNNFTFTFHFHALEKEMATHSSGTPRQCSYLEKPRDGGAWWAAIYGVAHFYMTFMQGKDRIFNIIIRRKDTSGKVKTLHYFQDN